MEDNRVVITILRDRLCYKAGTQIRFNQNDFNIIVGNNGSGKSTLINMLNHKTLKHLVKNGFISVENLKSQSGMKGIAEGFRSKRQQVIDAKREMKIRELNQKSHGEAWKVILEDIKNGVTPNSLILLDEPETALSIEAQIDLCEWLINYKIENPEFGCLIATHSMIIQELLAEKVILVPSAEEIPVEEYLKTKNDILKESQLRVDALKEKWRRIREQQKSTTDDRVSLKILKDRFCYKAGTEIRFSQDDFNIVVGNNGTGKSTLINMLNSRNNSEFSIENIKPQAGKRGVSEGFRSKRSQLVDSERELMVNKLNQRSHGEAWKIMLENIKSEVTPDGFIILDEPETALSVEAQIELCEWFINYKIENPEFGCLIATHSMVIQELLAENVILVPTGEEIPIEEYLSEKRKVLKERRLRIDSLKEKWNQSKKQSVI